MPGAQDEQPQPILFLLLHRAARLTARGGHQPLTPHLKSRQRGLLPWESPHQALTYTNLCALHELARQDKFRDKLMGQET